MSTLSKYLDANRAWAAQIREKNPRFFEELSHQQRPEVLWIGCSDSRLVPNQIIGLMPGELFVHRNVGNVVVHTDMNCLSVLQYGVEVLGVRHIIVCGHYGCGGVLAAMQPKPLGLIDNWLRHIRDVHMQHRAEVERIEDPAGRADRLCELNVETQVANVCRTNIVQDAWQRGQEVTVHGLIYSLADGLLHDLNIKLERPQQVPRVYRMDSMRPTPTQTPGKIE